MRRATLCACAAALAGVVCAPHDLFAGGAFENYGSSFRQIDMPPIGAGSFGVAGDALADGRIVCVTGTLVYVETAPGSGAFGLAGNIDSTLVGGATDPAFIRVSPSGERIALGAGTGKPLLVFDASALDAVVPAFIGDATADVFHVDHFDAAWRNDTELAISFGEFGQPARVTLLDTTGDPENPVKRVVIENIQGASAGVSFDAEGRLYTGNGFALGEGSDTGWIKAFEPELWASNPADFETDGVLIGDILSATGLRFDVQGNMFVGGGDFNANDVGTLAVVRADAIEDALAGMGPVDPFDSTMVKRIAPTDDPFAFYASAYNADRQELYITYTTFGGDAATTWFATRATVPADLNGDGVVNGIDLAILLTAWGPNPGHPADLNNDGVVDGMDLAILLTSWTPAGGR